MTDVRLVGSAEPRLQSDDVLAGSQSRPALDVRLVGSAEPRLQSDDVLEARPALLTLVAPGGAQVCEGDSCFVPGAEGDWSEVPD